MNWIKKIPTHKFIRPIMPILIIPVFSSIAIGGVMTLVNMPIADIMVKLGHWLVNMQQSSAIILALVLGAMIAFDMGGPVNKAAFFFGASMIEQGNYGDNGSRRGGNLYPAVGDGLGDDPAEEVMDRRAAGKRYRGAGYGNDWYYRRAPFRLRRLNRLR